MTVHRVYSVHLCRLKGLLYMVVDERIVTFINSLDTKKQRTSGDDRKGSAGTTYHHTREMQSFLRVLLMLKQPANVLEVGTAVGFSALLMSEAVPDGCRITTIENYGEADPGGEGELPPRRKRGTDHSDRGRCGGRPENT